jgi:tetraacyldisaccharide 4'-kinase
MREPDFWWRSQGWAAALLGPVATAYGAITAARLRRPGAAAGVPVLCVGNLTLGGAGKTPTALMVAPWLDEAGARPFFLTRGYGGRLQGPVRVELARHQAAEVGDEALLLARVAPTIVARDRPSGAQAARAAGAGAVVMDDGFQNPSLHKDFSIVVVDGRRGIGNGKVFPAGPLRAPLGVQLDRSQVVVIVGDGVGTGIVAEETARRGIPLFHATLAPERDAAAALAGRRVLAFAGIGDPAKFFATLAAAGCEPIERVAFPDHHTYTAQDARALLRAADRDHLVLVSTEKDLARLSGAGQPGEAALAELAARARALPVGLVCNDMAGFRSLILGALGLSR